MAPGANADERALDVDYESVGGWMLFLCISMAVIRPVAGSLQIYLEAAAFTWAQASFLGRVLFASAVGLELSVITFALVAGISLWRLHPRGVALARAFLLVQFLIPGFFLIALTIFVTILGGDSAALLTIMVPALARSFVFGLIWWLYLSRSQRVKRTYDLVRERVARSPVPPAPAGA